MLEAAIHAVVPVFGLILLGWIAAVRKWLPESAPETLNRFVIFLALPALLFISMSRADISVVSEIGLAASFGLGTLCASLLYLWWSRHEPLDATMRCIHSMSASYANAGFMGIPLILIVFGPEAIAASIVVCIMTVSVLFAVTIVAIEVQRSKGDQWRTALRKILISLVMNPLLIAPILGLLLATQQISVPATLAAMIDLLAAAATPCALLSIGLFLARAPKNSRDKNIPVIVWIKLIAHPALVAIFALYVFDVPSLWAWTAILAASLPVGTGPFMLANLYHQDAAVSAKSILLSTVYSAVTLTLLIAGLNYMQII